MRIEIDREKLGKWITEIPDLPGVVAYGKTREQAVSKAKALALRVIADRLDHGESVPELDEFFAVPASVRGPRRRLDGFLQLSCSSGSQ